MFETIYQSHHVYHLFISLTHLTKTNARTSVRQEEYAVPSLTRTTTFRVGTATLWGCPAPGIPDSQILSRDIVHVIMAEECSLRSDGVKKKKEEEVMVLCKILVNDKLPLGSPLKKGEWCQPPRKATCSFIFMSSTLSLKVTWEWRLLLI